MKTASHSLLNLIGKSCSKLAARLQSSSLLAVDIFIYPRSLEPMTGLN